MTDKPHSPGRRTLLASLAGIGVAAVAAFVVFPGMVARADADISDKEAYARQQDGRMVIVDIRTPQEWQETGIAKGAVRLDMTAPEFLTEMVALRQANPDKEIGLMCRTSHRSSAAQQALVQAGFDRIYSILGGIAGNGVAVGWIADGLPVEPWQAP